LLFDSKIIKFIHSNQHPKNATSGHKLKSSKIHRAKIHSIVALDYDIYVKDIMMEGEQERGRRR